MRAGRSATSTGVRIGGGRWRRRRLAVPAGAEVRPTPDRVRETLFNWLAPALDDARCLDLFAGTGVLGLEALSRGAAEAWFVERDAVLVGALRTRMRDLGAAGRVIRRDALRFLSSRPPRQRFDVAFVDPPYAAGAAVRGETLRALAAWLAPDHLVYMERPVRRESANLLEEATLAASGARLLKQGRAGSVAFGLLRLAPAE